MPNDNWLMEMPTDILNHNLLPSHLLHENVKVHTHIYIYIYIYIYMETKFCLLFYMCVKLGLSCKGKNKGWRWLKIQCWGRHLGIRRRNELEDSAWWGALWFVVDGYGTAERCIEGMRETAGKTVAYTVCRLAAVFHFRVQYEKTKTKAEPAWIHIRNTVTVCCKLFTR